MIKEWQHNLEVACMDFTIQGFFHKNINTTLISQGESYDVLRPKAAGGDQIKPT